MSSCADRTDRICSLDGLRAISIVFVLVGHLAGTRGFPLSEAAGSVFALGQLGVHVFFVISGFLITRLLLEELDRQGNLNLWRFYFRRTLRIFPPYYTLIVVLTVLQVAGWLTLAPHDTAHAVTYTSNYYTGRSWYFGHTWSLSVEEQFYLLWPAVMVFAGKRRAFVLAALAVLLVPAVRVGQWEFMRWSADGIGHRFETVADAIAIGCVLAGSRTWLHSFRPYMQALASPFFALVPLGVLIANLMHDHPLAYFGVGFTVMNVGAALCLDWCVTYPAGRIGAVLNARPVVYLGLMSYSLYLWQQLFLNRESSASIASFPLNIILAVGTALVSYHVVERPSLRLRRRIEQWVSTRRASDPTMTSTRPATI